MCTRVPVKIFLSLCEIIHRVEEINDEGSYAAVLISAPEYNSPRSLNATLILLLRRGGPIWQMSRDKKQLVPR